MDAAAISAYQAANSAVAQARPQGEVETSKNNLGMDDFFRLLTTQLVNQDPLQPMADTEFIAQMANFSSLAQMESIAANMKSLKEQQQAVAVQGLIGKEVVADMGDGEFIRGVINRVERVDGELTPFIGPLQVPYLKIVEISDQPSATQPGTDGETEESV